MKKRRYLSTVVAIVVLLALAGVAAAFTLGNVDGVWSTIDSGGGATDDAWATGPAGGSTNYDSPSSTSGTNPGIQGALGGTDWNQVRYGDGVTSGFGGQSGFGFDGVNDINEGDGLVATEQFLLGKWCHFNNPIYGGTSLPNPLGYVELNIQVDNITCPAEGTISPDNTMNFGYRFTLDETTNNGENTADFCDYEDGARTYECPYTVGTDPLCPFDGGINGNGCADEVVIGSTGGTDTFTCDYGGGATTEYTIRVTGFVPVTSTSACPATPQAAVSITYISREAQDSCACLYAVVEEPTGTAVELLSFGATTEKKTITLSWETATETDNAGFNLYRAEAVDGERIKLNAELIPTNVAPGSPFGAVYSYTDTILKYKQTYFYWLEDLDIYGNAELHGPVEVSPAPKLLIGEPPIKAPPPAKGVPFVSPQVEGSSAAEGEIR